MSKTHMHLATIEWSFAPEGVSYSRRHTWAFDGGIRIAASSSPSVVRPPYSDETAVDPEEALVATVASCHMLWFLDLAERKGFQEPSALELRELHIAANQHCFVAASLRCQVHVRENEAS